MTAPTATYRLQLGAAFGFDDAAEQVPYLADLGISHLYLSPILQPVPGSTHGYDVIRHDLLNADAGGREAFDRLVAAAHGANLKIIVDVVPNHMALPPATHLNRPLWNVLLEGPSSDWARWFDIDWAAGGNKLVLPILGRSVDEAVTAGEIVRVKSDRVEGADWILRYFEHHMPIKPGTEELDLAECVAAQHYRLAHWRDEADSMNYRRFFDVNSLIAIRVEDPVVFEATHALLLGLHQAGAIDGFRIDHPDGLADPAAYLDRLAEASEGAWVVVEKILEGDETLPREWNCAGTTGYDSLLRIQQVLTPPNGDQLTRLWRDLAPTSSATIAQEVIAAKLQVSTEVLTPEVERLLRCLAETPGLRGEQWDREAARRALIGLLVSMDRYRAYVVPGKPAPADQKQVIDSAAGRADELLGADRPARAALASIVTAITDQSLKDGLGAEAITRFGQTCGPVMAKGIEDTAFYRWLAMAGANEVGGRPDQLSIPVREFHDWMKSRQVTWPESMTALTTHDTKRSEDVRARLMTMAEDVEGWAQWVSQMAHISAGHRSSRVDGGAAYLIWQTMVGAWPLTSERLEAYVLKAVREAKSQTSWVSPDDDYEQAVVELARALGGDETAAAHIVTWLDDHQNSIRANILGQKLLQLTVPGVPDIYQGSELQVLTLVDPDNRCPVDYRDRVARLARIETGAIPRDLDEEKLRVVGAALRLRQAHPQIWSDQDSTYEPIVCSTEGLSGSHSGGYTIGPTEHLIAFSRGTRNGATAVVIVTRAANTLARDGGWGSRTLQLPPGRWRCRLAASAAKTFAGEVLIADLLEERPVALLEREP